MSNQGTSWTKVVTRKKPASNVSQSQASSTAAITSSIASTSISGPSSSNVSSASMPESLAQKTKIKQPGAQGSAGEKTQLIANFFPLTSVGLKIFHYDLNIEKKKLFPTDKPSEDKDKASLSGNGNKDRFESFIKKVTPSVVKTFIDANAGMFSGVPYVYDGNKNLYTSKQIKLPYEKFDLDHHSEGRHNHFVVSIKLVAEVDLTEVDQFYAGKNKAVSEKVISVYDLIFRFVQEKNFTSYQRAFYATEDSYQGEKVKLFDFVPGFMSSVRLTEFGLALNIHLKTTCMISRRLKTMEQLVQATLQSARPVNLEQLSEAQCRTVSRMVKHLQVQTNHTEQVRSYVVDSIVRLTPHNFEFNKSDGSGSTTIAEYFKVMYKMHNLKHYPLVKTTGGQKANYLPMELCTIAPNQFVADNKYDSVVQAELLTKSKVDPDAYFRKATTIARKLEGNELLAQFKIKLSTKPIQLTGRVLPSVRTLPPRNGFFDAGKPPAKWALYSFDHTCTKEQLQTFAKELCIKASILKLPFSQTNLIESVRVNQISEIENVIATLNNKKVEYIFAVIPEVHSTINPASIYNVVKINCDQKYGIRCSCIKADRLKKPPNGYHDKFLQKVNGKLGGSNKVLDPSSNVWRQLPFQMAETMVVGVDVNHPGATEKVLTSVSVAVGSYNRLMTQYSASIRVQSKERVEILQHVESMVKELLAAYYRHNSNRYPRNVFIFRDGVSEGQFKAVIENEIPNIRKALNDMERNIKLTVVVVQKRHHTRFALTNTRTIQMGKSSKTTFNVASGTVVDTDIVEPSSYASFVLNSHYSQLGTSKPTKYVVLKDELKLTTDQMQWFCFLACHQSMRTEQVISIPIPVKYADLCAYRAKLHIQGNLAKKHPDDGSSTTTSSDDGSKLDHVALQKNVTKVIAELNQFVAIQDNIRDTIYW